MKNTMQKPELLAPAGNMEKGKMALLYGADAIYLGGKMFGLRAFANNFSMDEITEITAFAHQLNKKVYVTVNIFAHNEDLIKLSSYLLQLQNAGVDALLISDLGVWMTAKETVPDMELHVSTQANTTNFAAVAAWKKLGAARVVLARELSLQEIAEIGAAVDVELEAFVHGAMCISYSGRCLLSSYLTGRDGNRGACAQACRWDYSLVEKNRPSEQFDIQEDARGTYIMNSKDLCLIDYLPDLMKAGVNSFKIEGRMKSVHYVASVVSVYRKAIDLCYEAPEKYQVKPQWREELNKVSHRPYTTGFAVQKPGSEAQVYATSSYEQTHDFVGMVLEYDAAAQRAVIEQRNNVKEGETLEVLMPSGELLELTLKEMRNSDGEKIDCAPHAQQKFTVASSRKLQPYSLLRRKIQ